MDLLVQRFQGLLERPGVGQSPLCGPRARRTTASSTSPTPATAWQAVEYANMPDDGSLLVLGLGRSARCARIAEQRGAKLTETPDVTCG